MQPYLDNFDIKILFYLQKNAKMPIKEISHKVHLSKSAVLNRIRSLESRCYIKNYVAVLNKTQFNIKLHAYAGVRLSTNVNSYLLSAVKRINQFPQVMSCCLVNGDFDLLLYIAVGDMQEYNNFYLHILSTIEGLSSISTFFVIDEIKEFEGIDLDI